MFMVALITLAVWMSIGIRYKDMLGNWEQEYWPGEWTLERHVFDWLTLYST